jgi:hypothetical protein
MEKQRVKTGKTKNAGVLQAFCPKCRHAHIFVRTPINHGMHLLLSLATLGLWLVSWAAICIASRFRPWRCERCGWHKPEFVIPHTPVKPHRESAPVNTRIYVQ